MSCHTFALLCLVLSIILCSVPGQVDASNSRNSGLMNRIRNYRNKMQAYEPKLVTSFPHRNVWGSSGTPRFQYVIHLSSSPSDSEEKRSVLQSPSLLEKQLRADLDQSLKAVRALGDNSSVDFSLSELTPASGTFMLRVLTALPSSHDKHIYQALQQIAYIDKVQRNRYIQYSKR